MNSLWHFVNQWQTLCQATDHDFQGLENNISQVDKELLSESIDLSNIMSKKLPPAGSSSE